VHLRPHLRSSVPVVAVICCLLVLAGCGAGADGTAEKVHRATADRSGWRYVAMGDSYTAGPLIPFVDITSGACLRSTNDYPRVLANWLGTRHLVDVSCSGAKTADMASPQVTLTGRVRPQLDAVSAGTDLVTVGIGGNDFALFGSITEVCRTLRYVNRTGNPCRRLFTLHGVDLKVRAARTVGRRVGAVVSDIRRRAPHATIVVLGYPRITGPNGRCRAHLFADGDSRWSDRVEKTLNRSVQAAVRRFGARFVDLYPSTRGHDACAGAAAWVNGAHTDPFRALAFHPLFTGVLNDAVQTYRAVVGRSPTDRQIRLARVRARQNQAAARIYAHHR
jgi:lysophospholipase L1-like esterase